MDGTAGTVLAIAAAVLAGALGGVYLVFAVMVMPALRSLPAERAVEAMLAVNASALRPPFLLLFFSGAATSAVLITGEVLSGARPGFLAGGVLALAAFVVTVVRNVPLNNALALGGRDAAGAWAAFDSGWGVANHIRWVASIGGSTALVAALGG